jgi:septal ring factor EnvC (AmiA/AmiB activator)
MCSKHSSSYKKDCIKRVLLTRIAEELQVLTQRMNVLKTEINQITRDINQSQHTLNTSKKSFLLAREIKQNEIQTELQIIAKYV